jgi:N-formylglutamate amidohydrolase
MEEPVYSLALPSELRSCAVFSSPHSGAEYPPDFLGRSRLSVLQMRSSEDAFVDELFGDAPGNGAPLLSARVSRAYVDLNRSPEDLDPALITGAARRYLTPRIAAGLGVIPRVVSEGRAIIDGKLTLSEARKRIDTHWFPYHARLRDLIDQSREQFGMAVLFDCHSMPQDALSSAPTIRGKRPDIVLGDRFGVSCERWVMEGAVATFREAGFAVARNTPFAGGYITQTYGRPREGLHALQIEINRSLYMDEKRIERRPDYADVAACVSVAVGALALMGAGRLRHAAE